MTSRPYLALAWRAASGDETAGVAARWLLDAGWCVALQCSGLSVWRRPERPVPVRAVAAGDVLIGHRVARVPVTREAPTGRPVERARKLCAEGFGGYVAMLREPSDERWWAFRDPSGTVEALTWTWADLAILTSSFDLAPAQLRPRSIGLDWTVIADFVRRPVSMGSAVALSGIGCIAHGEVRPVGAGEAQGRTLWRPRDWIGRGDDPGGDPAAHLRETALLTVAGLLQPYERLVTELSGGFDSSVVNAAIVRAGKGDRVVAALHYTGDRREADERPWAEAVAMHTGLPLQVVERPARAAIDPADFNPLSRSARPPYAALDSERDRDTAERVAAFSADALVTGKGGDSNFFQMPAPTVLADLWRARGVAALVDPTTGAMARWLRCSAWSAWRAASSPASLGDVGGAGRFAGWALRDLPAGAAHPWLADLEGTPPAKQVQIAALVGTQLSVGAHRRGQVTDVIQPLLAQPMMELCLSIPSWRLVEGGRDRGLARRAFAPWLPHAVAWRRSKGALTSIYARRLAAGLDAVRGHLLDGVLARAGLLDRGAMDAALSEDTLIRSRDALDLVSACAVESWVRYWQTRLPDAAPRPGG